LKTGRLQYNSRPAKPKRTSATATKRHEIADAGIVILAIRINMEYCRRTSPEPAFCPAYAGYGDDRRQP
jgi:hypothetical protein